MENHHHCQICGNMINPSRKICLECEVQQKPKGKSLDPFLVEAIEEYIEKCARKR